MTAKPGILFTAFERSGDEHAAPVIARLRRERPNLPIWALGGDLMAAAGATIIEPTTHKAAMLVGAAAQYFEHRKRLQRLAAFLAEHPLAALVPVDSPAANWSVCALVRKTHHPPGAGAEKVPGTLAADRKMVPGTFSNPGARIVHLVAPQLWAWAPWRIGKLRRLTDRVLCLLPFEEEWFSSRGVSATFVGHPVFDAASDSSPVGRAARPPSASLADPPLGSPKLALLPGSRLAEIKANWPTMLSVYERLRQRHPELCAIVAAVDEPVAAKVWEMTARARGSAPSPAASLSSGNLGTPDSGGVRASSPLDRGVWSGPLRMAVGQTPQVLDWCDLALVVSGTATLHVAVRRKPMVVLYNINRLAWNIGGRWLVQARTFALPNLLYQEVQSPESSVQSQGGVEAINPGRAVPEFVPHFGQVGPVFEAVEKLVSDPASREAQWRALDAVAARFAGRDYAATAAAEILRQVEGGR